MRRALTAVLLLLAVSLLPTARVRSAAPGTVDRLVSRLPAPESFARSPLETALRDTNPIVRDPDYQRLGKALRAHDDKAALRSARPLARRYPKVAPLQLLYGLVALSNRQLPEAEAAMRAAIAAGPSVGYGWYGLARVQIEANRPASAVASAQRAVALSPRFFLGWLLLANLQAGQSRFAQGTDAARHATVLLPKAAVGWDALGRCLRGQNKPRDAAAAFERAVRLAPGDATFARHLAEARRA